jgi:hypothetical protein
MPVREDADVGVEDRRCRAMRLPRPRVRRWVRGLDGERVARRAWRVWVWRSGRSVESEFVRVERLS